MSRSQECEDIHKLFAKKLSECDHFVALDGTDLCELLHPDREGVKLQMGYSIAHAKLKKGAASAPHFLKTSSEVYYILKGEGIVHIEDQSKKVQSGEVVYIPPGSVQHIENVGENELEFLCIVYPPWCKEYEVVL